MFTAQKGGKGGKGRAPGPEVPGGPSIAAHFQPSSVLEPVVAEPASMEEKLRQLKAMVELIRNRILFGVHWVSYTDQIEDSRRDGPGLQDLARNLNKRLLKHQVRRHAVH
jgi:hypothetical protein